MYNITLVCTRHDELGKCNSNELYKIIERISPELIFEEIPPSYFDKYYINKNRNNLESDTINKYSETHKVEHIPVDSENIPSQSLVQQYTYLLKRIDGLADINGFHYRTFTEKYISYVEMYGFKYLNSIYCINYYDKINDTIEKGLQKINNDELYQTYKSWKDINEKRENEMLQNVYNYSKEHSYDKAIFTVGAGHRKSLMQKIQEYDRKEECKLNWTFMITRFSVRGLAPQPVQHVSS
jgi:hypothetical protein